MINQFFLTIQFSMSFVCSQFNGQTVLFNQYSRTLSGATTPGQSRPGNNGNEEVLHIPQSFNITGKSPSDCLVSYPGPSLGSSYSSVEITSVYSTAPANWVKF